MSDLRVVQVPGRTRAEAQAEFAAAVAFVRREVCSPVHRCFPPRPTVCFLCGGTDRSGCLLDKASSA